MDRLRDTLPSAWSATTQGDIRFRQTTYWDVVTDGESRATRVHFVDKLEFGFTAASFVGVELTNQHPLLLDHLQPFDHLFVGSPPQTPDRVAKDIEALVNTWSGGWRAFARYGNSPAMVDRVLRAGYGCLMSGPTDVVRLVEQCLSANGAQRTVIPGVRETRFDPLLLRFGTNFVIARHFDCEEHNDSMDERAAPSVEQRFFERLESAAPELRSLRTEHEADNGELLGHLLMADIRRWACVAIDSQPGAVDAVLAEMARSLQPGDDAVSNMICVSFIEDLGAGDPRELAIRARLPGKLREHLERMESWRPRRE